MGGGGGKACEKGTLEAMDNYQYQRPQPTDFLIYCQRGEGVMPGLANFERDGEFFAHSRRLKGGGVVCGQVIR
jgi:hypothetical protein